MIDFERVRKAYLSVKYGNEPLGAFEDYTAGYIAAISEMSQPQSPEACHEGHPRWARVEGIPQFTEHLKTVTWAELEGKSYYCSICAEVASAVAACNTSWLQQRAKVEDELNKVKAHFKLASDQAVDLAQKLVKTEAERDRLRGCLESGKASAIVDGMFREAERLRIGSSASAKHALTRIVEHIESLRAERDSLSAACYYVISTREIRHSALSCKDNEDFPQDGRVFSQAGLDDGCARCRLEAALATKETP